MLRKMIISVIVITFLLSLTSFAISESDVQTYVDANGREAVSGNLLIWFLCAIAFLKVSQKIDSFMSALGINIGRTGGSMLGELMIASRAVTGAMGKGGFGKLGGSIPSAPGRNSQVNPLQGGLVGTVGRSIQSGAVSSVTGSSGNVQAGGVMKGIGGKVFQSSLSKGGDYANNVISTVAKGSINQTGSITGDRAIEALKSYMGLSGTQGTTGAPGNSVHLLSPSAATSPSATDISQVNTTQANWPGNPITFNPEATTVQDGLNTINTENLTNSTGAEIPLSPPSVKPSSYSDVEIGGGRISGCETSTDSGEARQFAMYSAEQYTKPEGTFDTVTTVDGSQWYRQYAQPSVEKTPYKGNDGNIKYSEKLTQKMPPVPRRKDKQ